MSDAPERIWAYNSLLDGYTFTAKGPQPHFDGVEYIRADLMAELVEAAKPFALLDETDDSIGDFCEKHPVEGGYVADLRAALAKLGVR